MSLAALHHPLQHGPFAEILQLLDLPFEFAEAFGVALQNGTLCKAPDSAGGGTGLWHRSYGDYTVGL